MVEINTKCYCKKKQKFDLGIYGIDTQNVQIIWQCKKCKCYNATYPYTK